MCSISTDDKGLTRYCAAGQKPLLFSSCSKRSILGWLAVREVLWSRVQAVGSKIGPLHQLASPGTEVAAGPRLTLQPYVPVPMLHLSVHVIRCLSASLGFQHAVVCRGRHVCVKTANKIRVHDRGQKHQKEVLMRSRPFILMETGKNRCNEKQDPSMNRVQVIITR